MRKNILLAISALILFVPIKIAAACDYKEENRLKELAGNVKADYTVQEREETLEFKDPDGNPIVTKEKYFMVNIYNLTSELSVNVIDKKTGETKIFVGSSAKDGVISFESGVPYELGDYTIEVNGISETCLTSNLRTMTVKVPRTNPYYTYDACRQKEAEDFYLCQEFISVDYPANDEDFLRKLDEHITKVKSGENGEKSDKNSGFISNFVDFLANYWYYIVVGAIAIGTVVAIIIVVRIRRREI